MDEYGWLKLHRQLLNWEWFKDAETLQLFLYCLLRANISNGAWRGISYKRGQFITSLDTICKDTGLSKQHARTRLKRLKLTGELTSESTNKFTIITICKFDDYQSVTNDGNNQTNTPITNNQHTNNKQSNIPLTTGREYEEDDKLRIERNTRKKSSKEDKKKNTFTPPTKEDVQEYMEQKGISSFDANYFVRYYEDRDWKIGRRKISDWRAVVDNWVAKETMKSGGQNSTRAGISSAGYGLRLPGGTEIH